MADKASRWDTPSSAPAPAGPTPNATAAAQAAAIAAKIAASLRPGVQGNELIKKSEDEGFVRDIEINDLRNRYVLTKGPTQKKVRESRGPQVRGIPLVETVTIQVISSPFYTFRRVTSAL
jgi:hypothetical protein